MANRSQVKALADSIRRLGFLYANTVSNCQETEHQLSKQEMLAIDVLGMRGACRMGEIATHLSVGQSAITPLIDRLEEKQLVRRIRSKSDRRVWLVELDQEGLATYKMLEKIYETVAKKMLAPLSSEESDTLASLLQRVTSTVLVEGEIDS